MGFPVGDLFSMGVVLMQVLIDQVPGTDGSPGQGIFLAGCTSLPEVQQATRTRQPPFELMPQSMSSFTSILKQVLQKHMTLRPRAPRILQDKLFSDKQADSLMPDKCFIDHPLATEGISDDFFNAVPTRAGVPFGEGSSC